MYAQYFTKRGKEVHGDINYMDGATVRFYAWRLGMPRLTTKSRKDVNILEHGFFNPQSKNYQKYKERNIPDPPNRYLVQ